MNCIYCKTNRAQSCYLATEGLELWDGWRLLRSQLSWQNSFCGRTKAALHAVGRRTEEMKLQWREEWPSYMLQLEFKSQPDPVLFNVLNI